MRFLAISAVLLVGLGHPSTTVTIEADAPEAAVMSAAAECPEQAVFATPEGEILEIAMAVPELTLVEKQREEQAKAEKEAQRHHRRKEEKKACPGCFADYGCGYHAALREHKHLVVWVGGCGPLNLRETFGPKVLHCCTEDWNGDDNRQFIFFTGNGTYSYSDFTEGAVRRALSMMLADPPGHLADTKPVQAPRLQAPPMQFFGGFGGAGCGGGG